MQSENNLNGEESRDDLRNLQASSEDARFDDLGDVVDHSSLWKSFGTNECQTSGSASVVSSSIQTTIILDICINIVIPLHLPTKSIRPGRLDITMPLSRA